MRQRWAINGRFLTQPVTGVQRYAREIVAAMDGILGENVELARSLQLELVVPRGADRLTLDHIFTREVGRLTGHAWEQLELPRYVRDGLVSLCNTGPLALANQIVCIHDLNPKICPNSYSLAFRTFYGALHPLLGRRARHVATVSDFSARQLVRFGISSAERIVVVPNGHEHVARWQRGRSPAIRAAAGRKTIVLLGSMAPHKNIRVILRQADRLHRAGFRVAVVGNVDRSVFADEGVLLADTPGITWFGRLSDGELAALLDDALCLAFPSLTEGFGLPPVEAMALGCPVVTSDRGSLPEICGDAALYADPTRPDEWFARFERLRDDPTLRANLVDRGHARARSFSWRRSAELYLRMVTQRSFEGRVDRSMLALTAPARSPAAGLVDAR